MNIQASKLMGALTAIHMKDIYDLFVNNFSNLKKDSELKAFVCFQRAMVSFFQPKPRNILTFQ